MDLELTLSANNTNVVTWQVDAAYTIRDDHTSQIGTMCTDRGVLMSKYTKQLNTKSST